MWDMAEQDFPCYVSGCSTLCKELTPLASCTSSASPGMSREHSCQVSLLVLLDTLQSMKNRRDSSSQAKGRGADSPKSIPLANAEKSDDKERERQAKEEHTGEGPPRGEDRCHSNHKQSVQSLKKPPE